MVTTRILIENIIVPYDGKMSGSDADATALNSACRKIRNILGVKCLSTSIHRKSIDARKKTAVKLVYSVYAEIENNENNIPSINNSGFKLYTEADYKVNLGYKKLDSRPVVIGFGPAGIFCALALAEKGYSPIVYERGGDVASRVKAVERFISSAVLDTECNIQFGAGGAGTFSDGKLTTRINDPLCSYVLSKLYELGAPEDIMTKAKPHIGTDILRRVVENADSKIRELGGEIHYNSKAEVVGDKLFVNGDEVSYGVLVLAIGHSSRDTYSLLMDSGYMIEAKAFSVGVRIEHLQSELDEAMFGKLAGDKTLGHAEYNVSYREGNRGVYSFCMCPGGEVMAAASEEFGVVTNGMSYRDRGGDNANAALAVSVLPDDYGATPSGAIAFQRELERKAFTAGDKTYSAPMQKVGDFLNGRVSDKIGRVKPTYMNGKVTPVDMRNVLPAFVTDLLDRGIVNFGKKIKGFDTPDAVLTGVETRTSAPVRIIRREDFTAPSHAKVYPCGEGAGYAGGIMSAAIDGLRVARAVMESYAPIN